ncbi:hypothetical protein [Pimelobacter sp. 30-1]|uniref:hypothetical protein n=1 Tax=Pimelobacter sp. 30-1 TaxID=2004991 RepID=UPI001C053DFD|nr:hypothetical protein [Pimelobacter sp. 30-1]
MITARVRRLSLAPTETAEPEGLAAVVETADGELYLRDEDPAGAGLWKRAAGYDDGYRHRYADLEVVAVRSAGYEPGEPGLTPDTAAALIALALRPGVDGTRRASTALAIYGRFAREVTATAGPSALAAVVGAVEHRAAATGRAA